MNTKTIYRAHLKPHRSFIDLSPLLVVLLLSVLFAAAITSAMAPHPIADVASASVQGGL